MQDAGHLSRVDAERKGRVRTRAHITIRVCVDSSRTLVFYVSLYTWDVHLIIVLYRFANHNGIATVPFYDCSSEQFLRETRLARTLMNQQTSL